MLNQNTTKLSSSSSKVNGTKKFLERNYRNNLESSYTEIISNLCKNFQYDRNSQHYWSDPELSLFYGTPLYKQSSQAQKLALNHLYWSLTYYRIVAESEIEATRYNLITAGSFLNESSDYQTIADMLEEETDQEYVHVKTFYKVGHQVNQNILEKHKNPKITQTPNPNFHADDSEKSKVLADLLSQLNQKSLENSELKKVYENNIYVKQLKEDERVVCTPTNGFFNGLTGNLPGSVRELFIRGWGSSPFLGCSFYVSRYISNLYLKNFEHQISKYYIKLKRQNEFIPEPTSISHYHFLDEAFHTTTSLKLGRDLYKELKKPSEYEKFFTNVLVYTIQTVNLAGISGVLPNRFMSDAYIMPLIYNLLRGSLFDMSEEEALDWMEKCLCYEHDGFYTNKTYHDRMLLDISRLNDRLDYLWPINKTMELVKLGGSLAEAAKNNAQAFKRFSYRVKNPVFS